MEALKLTAASHGAGEYAVAPLDALLETAKDDLKETNPPPPKVEAALKTCELVLGALRDCLAVDHPQQAPLAAKAQNRRGDCLLLSDRPAEALEAYHVAVALAPEDAYPIYNRGRAYLALGDKDAAKADFTAAAGTRFKQPKARKLALAALEAMR